jgi:hypothetical protein
MKTKLHYVQFFEAVVKKVCLKLDLKKTTNGGGSNISTFQCNSKLLLRWRVLTLLAPPLSIFKTTSETHARHKGRTKFCDELYQK